MACSEIGLIFDREEKGTVENDANEVAAVSSKGVSEGDECH